MNSKTHVRVLGLPAKLLLWPEMTKLTPHKAHRVQQSPSSVVALIQLEHWRQVQQRWEVQLENQRWEVQWEPHW